VVTRLLAQWATNPAPFGYTFVLQLATNLSNPAWTAVPTVPVILNGQYSVTNSGSAPQAFYRLSLTPLPSSASDGMVPVPAGSFTMGDTEDGESDAIPTNVMVSGFYMDTNLVSYGQWQLVHAWAVSNGYGFANAGLGKATNHPVQSVDWFDMVKWCNARSQLAGLAPVYCTDTNLTLLYTNLETAPYVNWTANGYRLPTEAEWEKAARAGLSGLRFPWGDTISESQANYYGDTNDYGYDLGPNGYNTNFDTGGQPYTSPVGYFPPNGYGLYDMSGNALEWCGDWYATTYAGGADPHGPASGSYRVMRGGYWNYASVRARCANRNISAPVNSANYFGFRCVRGL
jgi:formylglycine-generating enzyme